MLKTVDFNNVEIFAVGIWNGLKFTVKDLDNIVASYNSEKGVFSIPIKLGHNDKQTLLTDDMPAAGWIENVRRAGDKLVADFKRVPETVGDLIASGAFRKRSVELNRNFKIGENVYPLVLTGLALLGAKLPGVDTLADIVDLYTREAIETEEGATTLMFDAPEEESFDDMLTALDEFVNTRVTKHFKGRPGAPMLRGLHQAFRTGLQRAQRARSTNMDKKTLELLGLAEDADESAVEAAIQAKLGTPATPPTPVADEATKAELSRVSGELLKLQGELAGSKATALVTKAISDGKLLPAQKDFALKFALSDESGFNEFIDKQPQLVEFGERGSQGGDKNDGNFAQFEPTAAERQAATSLGITQDDAWRQSIMMEKSQRVGITIPTSFFSKAS